MLQVVRRPLFRKSNPSGKFGRGCMRSLTFAISDPQSKLDNPFWGHSSVGRAPALQAGSQGFESPCLHFIFDLRFAIVDLSNCPRAHRATNRKSAIEIRKFCGEAATGL